MRAILAIASRYGDRNFPILRRLAHVHREKIWTAKGDGPGRTFRNDPKRLGNRTGNSSRKRRGHRIADLARTMPLCYMQPKPIRIPVKARHFPNRDAARNSEVDGTWTRKRASGGVRACPERVADTVSV